VTRTDLSAAGVSCLPFAVVRARDWSEPVVASLAGGALRLLSAGEVALVVGDAEAPARNGAARSGLLFHELVVERLARGGRPVAPLAPVGPPADEAALCAWLEAASASLREALERLDGRCEIGVLAWWDRTRATALDDSAPGAAADAYDRALAASFAQQARLRTRVRRDPSASTFLPRRELRAGEAAAADACAVWLATAAHERLSQVAELGRVASPPAADVLLDAAYLVRRDRLAALDAAIAGVAALGGGAVTVRRSGPRAAWAFATLRPFTRADRTAAAGRGAERGAERGATREAS